MLAGMGAPGYLAPWARLTSEWTRATVVDLPGWSRGRARSCAASVVGISTALANWLQARDLRNAVLLGHSTGAQAVLRTALQAQERVGGVVLAGPGLPPEIRRPAPLTREIFATIPREPADEIESIAPSFLSSGGPGLFRLLRDGMVQRPEDLVGELDVPVPVLTGEHDGLAPPAWARHLSQLARTGTLVVLPGAHNACFPYADAADVALHATVERWAL